MPAIEPEIVVKLAHPIPSGGEPTAAVEAFEWIALGFEIIDCAYPDWKFQPADFVAAFGLHAALAVGEPQRVTSAVLPLLASQLAQFTVRLSKNGQLVEVGAGRNALKSPVHSVAELAAAVGRQPRSEPLEAGHLVSTGTLTTSQPCGAGEQWTAEVEGIDLRSLTIRLT